MISLHQTLGRSERFRNLLEVDTVTTSRIVKPCQFTALARVAVEVLALRQQVEVPKRRRPRPLRPLDRICWTLLRVTWSRWKDALVSLATKTSWKNDVGGWESRSEWHRCVAFRKLADFPGTLSKGAHVAIGVELPARIAARSHCLRQRASVSQRVWGNPHRLRSRPTRADL